jgi:hypothetical protein
MRPAARERAPLVRLACELRAATGGSGTGAAAWIGVRAASCELRAASCGLRAASCELRLGNGAYCFDERYGCQAQGRAFARARIRHASAALRADARSMCAVVRLAGRFRGEGQSEHRFCLSVREGTEMSPDKDRYAFNIQLLRRRRAIDCGRLLRDIGAPDRVGGLAGHHLPGGGGQAVGRAQRGARILRESGSPCSIAQRGGGG